MRVKVDINGTNYPPFGPGGIGMTVALNFGIGVNTSATEEDGVLILDLVDDPPDNDDLVERIRSLGVHAEEITA